MMFINQQAAQVELFLLVVEFTHDKSDHRIVVVGGHRAYSEHPLQRVSSWQISFSTADQW
jgi:hypothetical protein